VWRPRNLGDARLWGLEADASLRVPAPWREGIQLTASGTWLRSQDRTGEPNVDGRDLVYRPGWTGALGLRVEDALAGSWEALARGASRAWVTRANTKSIPAYVVVDLRWRRAIALGLGADVTVTNVGDVSVRDFRDYPLPGRAVTVGLSWESGRS
jgi:outer membrane receptor protein involved in Fe transport